MDSGWGNIYLLPQKKREAAKTFGKGVFQRTNNRIRVTMNASKPIGLGAIFLPIFKHLSIRKVFQVCSSLRVAFNIFLRFFIKIVKVLCLAGK